jgi:hypothetical protein
MSAEQENKEVAVVEAPADVEPSPVDESTESAGAPEQQAPAVAQVEQSPAAASPPAPAAENATPTAPIEPSPKKVAVVSAGHAPPQPPPRQMTREEFLRQMGLAPDDLVVQVSPSRIRESIASSSPPKPVAPVEAPSVGPAQAGGDDAAPEVIQDDQWVRSTVFADPTLIQSGVDEQNATNEARKAILESYRASRSGGGVLSVVDGVPVAASAAAEEQRAQDMVTKEDHAMASDYKSSLLEEYRRRKTLGEAKQPPPVSPSRQRVAVESS